MTDGLQNRRSTRSKMRKRSGLYGLMARVSSKGFTGLDRRSAGYRALLDWRRELERDLGGPKNLSAQQRTLVEMAARVRLFLDHLDGFLMEQSSLVNKRRKSVLPILRERQTLADSLQRILTQLGIARVEPPAPSLADILREHDQNKQETSAPDDASDEDPELDEINLASDAVDESAAALEPEP